MEESGALTCFGLLATILCVDLIAWTFKFYLGPVEKKKTPSNKTQHRRIAQQASLLTQGVAESPNHNPGARVSASPIFLQGYCQSHCGIISVSSLVSPHSITLVAQKSQEDRETWHWCPSERKFQQDKMAQHVHHLCTPYAPIRPGILSMP